ncbi:hypothetical protein [Paucisalibacillus sp. EB02]|uniref:hypothetical protein n=1 Tax=Paucisalibacillus sp. EB02 TaxID=1347087 RepID=UPI0004B1D4E5|nr:hypothetical protein [Paucisalibacillus sp. EB02]
MQLWMVILVIFSGLILIGVIFDFIAKKKKLRFDAEEGIKETKEYERVYKEAHLKQSITDINSPE